MIRKIFNSLDYNNNIMDIDECSFVNLFETLEDGTIDDIAGESYWHLEKMKKGEFVLTVGNGQEYFNIYIKRDGDDIRVISYDN